MAAMTRADLARQMASLVRCRSAADTATDHTRSDASTPSGLFPYRQIRQLSADVFLFVNTFFGESVRKIFRLEHLANLNPGFAWLAVGAALDPLAVNSFSTGSTGNRSASCWPIIEDSLDDGHGTLELILRQKVTELIERSRFFIPRANSIVCAMDRSLFLKVVPP